MAGSYEHDNESLGSFKSEEFLDYLSDFYLLKKDSAPWSYVVTSCMLFSTLSLKQYKF
jgi:hypothetical protein